MVIETYGGLLFDLLSDHSEHGIAVIGTDGRFLYYNKAMGEIEGLDSEEMLGGHVFEIFPSSNFDNSSIYRCLETGEPIFNNLQTYINFKGKKITSLVTDIPIIVDGEVKGVIEIVRDAGRMKHLYESYFNLLEDEESACKARAKRLQNAYYEFDDFKTNDEKTKGLLERIKHSSVYGSNTLIYGETGTGKEIIAQSIHNHGKRKTGPFIAQNCAALPENLMESILFGSVRGSFTGSTDMSGLFEQAHGGTLLLDELNSLPPNLQAKLLRVLQEGRVKRLGGNQEKTVDVHVIATIHESPHKLMKEGRLREDLFFRLSAMYIEIPPLRERKGDIEHLIDFYGMKYAKKFNLEKPHFSQKVEQFLHQYEWRGNVRELMNIVGYVLINQNGSSEIDVDQLPHYLQEHFYQYQQIEKPLEEKYSRVIDLHEKKLIEEALEKNMWNVSKTARSLNIKRQTLHNKMKRLGIDRPK